jgi:hypothetical protein
VKEQGERYVPGFKVSVIQRRDRYLRGGDHMPFLERGYAALRFTEPAEDFSHQHQNLRTENGKVYGDLPEYNDYNYIAQVARVNAAALARMTAASCGRPTRSPTSPVTALCGATRPPPTGRAACSLAM